MECRPPESRHHGRERYKCNRCEKEKPRAEFSVVVQKRKEVKQWRCLECQHPTRKVCGTRTEQPINHKYDESDYFCTSRAWPLCSGGCGAIRPGRNGKYHVWRMLQWFCRLCRGQQQQ